MTEKLMEQIERNRTDSEERARQDKKGSEKKAKDDLKDKETSLRQEAEDKRKISELETKVDYDKKLKALEDKNRENEKGMQAQIEQAKETIRLVRDDMSNNYQKKPKGGCE